METCINYCEPGWAYMSSDERRWINHMRKLAELRPAECIIIKQPEDNDGFIYSKFPVEWTRVAPPRQVSMTDEQRAKRREFMINLHRSQLSERTQQCQGK